MEYAFDIKLVGVARVQAESEKEARAKLFDVLDSVGAGEYGDSVSVTEFSISQDSSDAPQLFEIDGEEPGTVTR